MDQNETCRCISIRCHEGAGGNCHPGGTAFPTGLNSAASNALVLLRSDRLVARLKLPHRSKLSLLSPAACSSADLRVQPMGRSAVFVVVRRRVVLVGARSCRTWW